MKTVPIEKSAGSAVPTSEQLSRINLFTRRELTADEVYVFSVILCDNEIDRDGEQFPEESLSALGELYIGKTGVFDHDPKAENQSARIFSTELLRGDGKNTLGEPLCSLKAFAYMVRCEKTADLILEIDAGIKKEVSVGCAVARIECSICGANQKLSPCKHQKNKVYDGKICCHRLLEPTDAYEWSFVAVPAQKNAGVIKRFGLEEDGEVTLAKLFCAASGVTLDQGDLAALRAEYDHLQKLARAGEAYFDHLRRDVVKLCSFAQPELSASVMESVAGKLTLQELLELQKCFGKTAVKAYPPAPQLGVKTEKPTTANNSFLI